jgi:hypothetical protein
VTVGRATHEGGERLGSGPVVFVSYAREDADWLRQISVMLDPEVRNRRMQLWSDTAIGTGRKWRPEIEDAIARADIALLLVSPDFLASAFIMDVELPALRERGVPWVPVLLRPCLYGAVAELADWQWAHDPGVDGPVATSGDVEGAIVRVSLKLMGLVDERARSAPPAAGDEKTSARPGAVSVPALAGSPDAGALHGVPNAPLGFVEREEIGELRAALLSGGRGAVAITGGGGLGLYGQGGIGKTVLAAALARDDELRRHFPDGVYWIALGERWQNGDMCLRWTAAGMLEAERQFRKIIGYKHLAALALAVERDVAAGRVATSRSTTPTTATEPAATLAAAH